MLLPANTSSLLRRVLTLPATRVIILTAILWLTGFAYCKHRFWRDPHSAFFSSDHVYDLHYSADRQAQAQTYISRASESKEILPKATGTPEICAAFVTVKRDKIQYVDEAVASLLEGLDEEERGSLAVQILFVDTETKIHPSFEKPWLRNAVDAVIGYNVSGETMNDLKTWEKERNFYKKGVFDYLYALRSCYDTGASYVLMFEDDIIIIDGWMVKTRDALRIIASNSRTSNDAFWNWIYLRLFYTETSMQWEDTDFWFYHMFLTFGLASTAGLVLLLSLRKYSAAAKQHLDNLSIAAICIITIPAFGALLFMIGKYSLLPPSTVFTLNKRGCCTQALLFPRPQIPDLIKYLEERGHGQTDTMIEDYADRDAKQRLATGKQLVQHVGLTSSRDNTFINSQSTWAFWFETYNVQQLKREKEYLRRKLGTSTKRG